MALLQLLLQLLNFGFLLLYNLLLLADRLLHADHLGQDLLLLVLVLVGLGVVLPD